MNKVIKEIILFSATDIEREMFEAKLLYKQKLFDKIKYCTKCKKPHLETYKLCPVCKSYMYRVSINADSKYEYTRDDPFETLKCEETDRRYCLECREWFPKQYCQCPICKKETMDYPQAIQIVIRERVEAVEEFNRALERVKENEAKKVHCPYCNSTSVKKITATSRTTSILVWGIGSGKIGKQWHCYNCKSDF